MFTGLIESIGTLRAIRRIGADAEFEIVTSHKGLALGESIAVDGVCLTVARLMHAGSAFLAQASSETLARTTLGALTSGQEVHLERAVAVGQRLGGHIVTGHVDGVGRVAGRQPDGDGVVVRYEAPAEIARFIAEKGSIAIDGTSLTVNRVTGAAFEVMLVPYTRAHTKLDRTPVGAAVNLEVDILARYVARLMEAGSAPGAVAEGVGLDLLARQGYL